MHSSLRSDALGCLVVTHASRCEAQYFPCPIIFLPPSSLLQMTVPLQGVMENDLVGTMQGQWQHQARVEWSHREGAVFHWRQQSSAFHFNGIFILTAWQSQPEICDVPSADVAICVQFLFVSVAVPPFNPSFTFPLCSELPLYFLAALFSAYSSSTASHSFLHWKAPHCLAWLSSQKPTTWLLNV